MIDIIIPTYNCNPQTFERCIESIAEQTIYNQIQVTIIDDCSQDTSFLDILINYPEVKVYRMPENCGPGCARAQGIINTNNEYIVFVDSDDTLHEPQSLEKLLAGLLEFPSNVMCYSRFNQIIDPEEENFTINHLECETAWVFGKIYKREFLKKNNITFPSIYSWANEDNGFNALCVFCIGDNESIGFISDVTYNWIENKNSLTHQPNYHYGKGLIGYVENIKWALSQVFNPEDEKQQLYCTSCLMYLYQMYVELLHREPAMVDDVLDTYKTFYKEIYSQMADKINDQTFLEIYNDRMRILYRENAFYDFIPNLTIYDFIALLKEEV